MGNRVTRESMELITYSREETFSLGEKIGKYPTVWKTAQIKFRKFLKVMGL